MHEAGRCPISNKVIEAPESAAGQLKSRKPGSDVSFGQRALVRVLREQTESADVRDAEYDMSGYLSSGIRRVSSAHSSPIAALITLMSSANAGWGKACIQILVMFSRSPFPRRG